MNVSSAMDGGVTLGFYGNAPAEFHVIWFPSEDAFDAYLRDQRRAEMLSRHGDVFTNKVVVRLDPIAPEPNSFRS